jgi:alpha-tubulin suppressor-like RCC1 family protein
MFAVGLVAHEQKTQATVIVTDRMALGSAHSCVINNDNTVWCWGSNASGQLGASASIGSGRSTVPVRVDALPGGRVAVKIAAGASHTCVLAQDGTVWCWGGNGSGQVGGTDALVAQPQETQLPEQAVSIYAGSENSCALLLNNELFCWGSNQSRQLGIGPNGVDRNPSPLRVLSIPESLTVADLSIGRAHMCAIGTTNTVWCWGGTSNGKLARAPGVNVTAPQQITAISGPASRAASGSDHTCIALAASVSCFGDNLSGQLAFTPLTETNSTPTPIALDATVQDVVAGADFTCVRMQNTTPQCWGNNSTSQLGTGNLSTSSRVIPGAVMGLDSTVVDIAAGASHSCALMASGQVRCWGANNIGQLGLGDINSRHTATEVSTLNVVPTTTTTTTTTTTIDPHTTTTNPSSTAPSVSTPKPLVTKLYLRRGRTVSAAKIARAVSMTIPKTSQGKLRISIVGGSKYCAFGKASIRGVRKGLCTVSVTLVPKRGRPITRKTTISVT